MRSPRKRGPIFVGGAAIAILVALVPIMCERAGGTRPEAATDGLVASLRDLPYRMVAPRLSQPFDYRPLQTMARWKRPNDAPSASQVLVSVAEIERSVEGAPTSANLHVLGLSYLISGRVRKAVQLLQQARLTTTDHGIVNDLAAAYYVAGAQEATAADMARSLELSDLVLRETADDLPARFNRALALEALENRPAALIAWRQYLRLDSYSQWAGEAQQHVRRLSIPAHSSQWESLKPRLLRLDAAGRNEAGPIGERFPLRCRRAVENDFLPRWAYASTRLDEEEAGRLLAAVEAIGSALEKRFADPTIAEIARTISSATVARDERRLDALSRGYQAYADARKATGQDSAKASALFQKAQKNFHDAGSPSAYAAGMFAAAQEYERRNYGEALHLLAEMKAERELTRYAPLLGQILWMEGLVLLVSGRPYESLQRYREAVAAFERSGEAESVAAVDGLIAENLQALGDDDEAWKHRLRALPIILEYGDARRQQVALNEAAEAALQESRFAAALAYQASSVALTAGTTDHEMAAYAFLGHALILGRMSRFAPALADIERAREQAGRVIDVAIRQTTGADIDMAEALLRQQESPSVAVSLLTRVLNYQHSGGYQFRAAQLHLARGRTYARLGDHVNARQDFSHAIAAVESQRERVSDLRLRSTLFGRAEDAYIELTASLVRSGQFGEALRVFDRSCERTLTEIIRGRLAAESITRTARPSRALADGTALVEIAVLPDEIVAWTTRRSGVDVSRHPIASTRIEELVASYERAIQADSESETMIGSELYDVVIRPLRLRADDQAITFVVDRLLRPVPLASLYDRSRKRYLLEDFAIANAPSATAYWHCNELRRRVRTTTEVVAIGNTKVSSLPLGLPDLPDAERELTQIASQTHGRLLLNERATTSSFLAVAAEEVVVHFAGHALVDAQDRGRSAIVLAPEGADSSTALLYADRIASSRLHAPLVVLSSCTTSAYGRAATGTMDVARAFLAAGVPTVVTSRWEVADDSARNLLTRFARELAGSPSPAEALRRAQLETLRRNPSARRHVRSWCAFEVIGAF
jgi:CHAT domain-containing protein